MTKSVWGSDNHSPQQNSLLVRTSWTSGLRRQSELSRNRPRVDFAFLSLLVSRFILPVKELRRMANYVLPRGVLASNFGSYRVYPLWQGSYKSIGSIHCPNHKHKVPPPLAHIRLKLAIEGQHMGYVTNSFLVDCPGQAGILQVSVQILPLNTVQKQVVVGYNLFASAVSPKSKVLMFEIILFILLFST